MLQGVKADVSGADCFDLSGTSTTCTLDDHFSGHFSVVQELGGKGDGVLHEFSRILRTDTANGLRDGAFEAGDDLILEEKTSLRGHRDFWGDGG